MKLKINDLFLYFISITAFTIGYMFSFDMISTKLYVENSLIGVMAFLLLAAFRSGKITYKKSKNLLNIVWLCLIIIIIVSSFINKNYFINLLFLLPIFLFLNVKLDFKTYKIIYFCAIITIIPFIIYYFLFLNIENNNVLGINLCVVGTLTINYFLERENLNKNFILIISAIIIYLIYLTRSRTSIVVFLFIFVTNLVYLLKYHRSRSLILLVIILSLISLLYINKLYELIFYKFGDLTKHDFLSGRLNIWKKTIENGVSIFGKGRSFFRNYTNIDDAHNVFLQVFGQYGIIAFIAFIIFTIIIYKYIFSVKPKLTLLNFFNCFFILGFFENLFITSTRMISIVILFFIYLSQLSDKLNRRSNI